MKMRIAQVAPVATTIPPLKAGSVELMTSLLTEELIKRGHQVTLFAAGDSRTKAKLHAVFPHGYRHDEKMYPWEFYEMLNLSAACERAADFDLIHFQSEYYPMALVFSRLVKTPIVNTVHFQPGSNEIKLWKHYPEANFIAISKYQAAAMRDLNCVGTVHHGIDIESFTFNPNPDDYLVFLGRFTPEKGVIEAIKVAKRIGIRLLIAAPENQYFHQVIKPHIDGKLIEYVGEVDHESKNKLLGGAVAIIYPVQIGEPFGLVLIEAMACGTPVLASDNGAVSEIVINGSNGFYVRTLSEMVKIFPEILKLNRTGIRNFVVERFDVSRMVEGYVSIYKQILNVEKKPEFHKSANV